MVNLTLSNNFGVKFVSSADSCGRLKRHDVFLRSIRLIVSLWLPLRFIIIWKGNLGDQWYVGEWDRNGERVKQL